MSGESGTTSLVLATRNPHKLREFNRLLAPAGITVITQEDIRRSGATSLPEALRLASKLSCFSRQ